MNNCSWSEERFERFLDGELAAHERSGLVAHLDLCGHCRALLEELRAVDALLLTPRRIDLAENFTFATMAEIHGLPAPRRHAVPLAAYALSYLATVWILIGAAWLIAPAVIATTLAPFASMSRVFADATAGIAGSLAHVALRDAGIGTPALIGLALVLDAALALVFLGVIAVVRPRIAERLRS